MNAMLGYAYDSNAKVPRVVRIALTLAARLTGSAWFVYWDIAAHRHRLWFGRVPR